MPQNCRPVEFPTAPRTSSFVFVFLVRADAAPQLPSERATKLDRPDLQASTKILQLGLVITVDDEHAELQPAEGAAVSASYPSQCASYIEMSSIRSSLRYEAVASRTCRRSRTEPCGSSHTALAS